MARRDPLRGETQFRNDITNCGGDFFSFSFFVREDKTSREQRDYGAPKTEILYSVEDNKFIIRKVKCNAILNDEN